MPGLGHNYRSQMRVLSYKIGLLDFTCSRDKLNAVSLNKRIVYFTEQVFSS